MNKDETVMCSVIYKSKSSSDDISPNREIRFPSNSTSLMSALELDLCVEFGSSFLGVIFGWVGL